MQKIALELIDLLDQNFFIVSFYSPELERNAKMFRLRSCFKPVDLHLLNADNNAFDIQSDNQFHVAQELLLVKFGLKLVRAETKNSSQANVVDGHAKLNIVYCEFGVRVKRNLDPEIIPLLVTMDELRKQKRHIVFSDVFDIRIEMVGYAVIAGKFKMN